MRLVLRTARTLIPPRHNPIHSSCSPLLLSMPLNPSSTARRLPRKTTYVQHANHAVIPLTPPLTMFCWQRGKDCIILREGSQSIKHGDVIEACCGLTHTEANNMGIYRKAGFNPAYDLSTLYWCCGFNIMIFFSWRYLLRIDHSSFVNTNETFFHQISSVLKYTKSAIL